MKQFKKCIAALLMTLALVAGVSVALPEATGTTVEAATIKLNATKLTLVKGKTYLLKLKNATKPAGWKSSNSSVATVYRGKVTAKKAGKTTITATLNGKKYTCKVTVENPKLSKTTLTLQAGKSYYVRLSGTTQQVTWKSNKPAYASVTRYNKYMAKVTAKKQGTATITATTGGKKFYCKVTITKKPASKPTPETEAPPQTEAPETEAPQPAVPAVDAKAVDLSFDTVNGGAFVYGISTAEAKFHLNETSGGVTVAVKNAVEDTVLEKKYSVCNKDEDVVFTWDGKTAGGQLAPAGTYTIAVTSGTITTVSPALVIKENIFNGGTGSAADPFLVATLDQLKRIGEYNGFCLKQIADISGNNKQEEIKPQFSVDNPFNGTYDGNGFTIKDFVLRSGTPGTALFGGVGEKGRLENVHMDNFDIFDNGATVALAGTNYGTINNCKVTSCSIIQKGHRYAGFLCNDNYGRIAGCTVENSTISATGASRYIGGLVIDNREKGTLKDSRLVNCTVIVTNYDAYWDPPTIGGLVRWNGGTMENCSVIDATLQKGGREGRGGSAGICYANEGFIRGCSFTGIADMPGCASNKGMITE